MFTLSESHKIFVCSSPDSSDSLSKDGYSHISPTHLTSFCPFQEGEVLNQQWSPFYVFLSVLFAFFGATMTTRIINRILVTRNRLWIVRLKLLFAVSIGGSTVWSMHFVGMQALSLGNKEISKIEVEAAGSESLSNVRRKIQLTNSDSEIDSLYSNTKDIKTGILGCIQIKYDAWSTLFSLIEVCLVALVGIHILVRPSDARKRSKSNLNNRNNSSMIESEFEDTQTIPIGRKSSNLNTASVVPIDNQDQQYVQLTESVNSSNVNITRKSSPGPQVIGSQTYANSILRKSSNNLQPNRLDSVVNHRSTQQSYMSSMNLMTLKSQQQTGVQSQANLGGKSRQLSPRAGQSQRNTGTPRSNKKQKVDKHTVFSLIFQEQSQSPPSQQDSGQQQQGQGGQGGGKSQTKDGNRTSNNKSNNVKKSTTGASQATTANPDTISLGVNKTSSQTELVNNESSDHDNYDNVNTNSNSGLSGDGINGGGSGSQGGSGEYNNNKFNQSVSEVELSEDHQQQNQNNQNDGPNIAFEDTNSPFMYAHQEGVSRPSESRIRLVALALGFAVASMHYLGVLAQKGNFEMTFDPLIVLISCIDAIVVSYAGLRILLDGSDLFVSSDQDAEMDVELIESTLNTKDNNQGVIQLDSEDLVPNNQGGTESGQQGNQGNLIDNSSNIVAGSVPVRSLSKNSNNNNQGGLRASANKILNNDPRISKQIVNPEASLSLLRQSQGLKGLNQNNTYDITTDGIDSHESDTNINNAATQGLNVDGHTPTSQTVTMKRPSLALNHNVRRVSKGYQQPVIVSTVQGTSQGQSPHIMRNSKTISYTQSTGSFQYPDGNAPRNSSFMALHSKTNKHREAMAQSHGRSMTKIPPIDTNYGGGNNNNLTSKPNNHNHIGTTRSSKDNSYNDFNNDSSQYYLQLLMDSYMNLSAT